MENKNDNKDLMSGLNVENTTTTTIPNTNTNTINNNSNINFNNNSNVDSNIGVQNNNLIKENGIINLNPSTIIPDSKNTQNNSPNINTGQPIINTDNNIINQNITSQNTANSINNQNTNNNINITANTNINNNQNLNINNQQQNINNIQMPNINQNISSDNLNTTNNNQYQNQDFNNNEELLKSFIGNNYDKIVNSGFSLCGFFFGEFYYFYRKMYLYGFIIILLKIFLLNAVNGLISIALYVLLGLFTNKIYLNFANSKINKIKNKNPSGDLSRICSAKGGTSIGMIFVALILDIVLLIIYVILMIVLNISIGIVSLFGSLGSDIMSSPNGEYNGVLSYNSSVVISDDFSFDIPSMYQEGFLNSEYVINYTYKTDENEILSNCEFSFAAIDGYSSSSELINQIAEYNKVSSSVSNTTINNIVWYTTNYNDGSLANTYYYATEKNNMVYLVQYEIGSNVKTNVCEEHKTAIINSIKNK